MFIFTGVCRIFFIEDEFDLCIGYLWGKFFITLCYDSNMLITYNQCDELWLNALQCRFKPSNLNVCKSLVEQVSPRGLSPHTCPGGCVGVVWSERSRVAQVDSAAGTRSTEQEFLNKSVVLLRALSWILILQTSCKNVFQSH